MDLQRDGVTTTRRATKTVRYRSRVASDPAPTTAARPTAAGLRAHVRYRFDNTLTRGPMVVVLYLGVLTAVLVAVTSIIAVLMHVGFGDGSRSGFGENLWQTVLRTLDPGTFANDESWRSRFVALVITLGGIFVVGSLIGLIANAVDQRVEQLRHGRSQLIERDHTLILGWSNQVPQIVAELVAANESRRGACIAVLSEQDPREVETQIRQRVGNLRTTRLVSRRGDPADPQDLEMCCLAKARSVVIPRGDRGDAGVVRSILAVHAVEHDLAGHNIVAELHDPDHASAVRAISGGNIVTVSSERVVAEVTAQACLQPGRAAVFTDLLDFDGHEIYVTPVGALAGRRYCEALQAYEASSVIGVVDRDGRPELAPRPDRVLDACEELVVVAEDDSTINMTGIVERHPGAPKTPVFRGAPPRNVVVIGWSCFGEVVLREMDRFLAPGSTIHVLVDQDLVDIADVQRVELCHARMCVRVGTGAAAELDEIDAWGQIDQVLVLAYREAVTPDHADARTMLHLMMLRNRWPSGGEHAVRIVGELLDERNVRIATPVGADDLIVSQALASQYVAQVAERPDLEAVFDELFDVGGARIELQPYERFVGEDDVEFGDLVAGAARCGGSAFGVRFAATQELVLNPPKALALALSPGDEVVMVARQPVSCASI